MPIKDFAGIDAVIHLAGETIAQRWTTKAKKRIHDSRIVGTTFLTNTIFNAKKKPKLFISASGINIYKSQKDTTLPSIEDSPLAENEGFLSNLAKDWEQSTKIIEQTETRLVLIRIGMVLSSKDGALASLLPIFKAGFGGPQGSGKQLVSWIDISDLVNAIYFCILNPSLQGPVNIVAPQVITNAEFSQALAHVLHRPCWLKTPAFLLKLILGQFAEETILKSSNVYPQKLIDSEFQFKYETIEKCLQHLLKQC